MTWLQEQVPEQDQLRFTLHVLLRSSIIVMINMLLIYAAESLLHRTLIPHRQHNLSIISATTPVLIIVYAAVEECIFRVPLALIATITKQPWVVGLAMITLSVIFAIVHGSWWNIPIQGVLGFGFSIVFLKCGGYAVSQIGGRGMWTGFRACWFAHAAFNLSLLTIIFLCGARSI